MSLSVGLAVGEPCFCAFSPGFLSNCKVTVETNHNSVRINTTRLSKRLNGRFLSINVCVQPVDPIIVLSEDLVSLLGSNGEVLVLVGEVSRDRSTSAEDVIELTALAISPRLASCPVGRFIHVNTSLNLLKNPT